MSVVDFRLKLKKVRAQIKHAKEDDGVRLPRWRTGEKVSQGRGSQIVGRGRFDDGVATKGGPVLVLGPGKSQKAPALSRSGLNCWWDTGRLALRLETLLA